MSVYFCDDCSEDEPREVISTGYEPERDQCFWDCPTCGRRYWIEDFNIRRIRRRALGNEDR